MSSNARVLVTGASGFIAGHCIQELIENGYRVRGTVRSLADPAKIRHLQEMAERLGGEIELVEADLTRDEGWAEAVAGCKFVWHVASPFPAARPENEDELVRPAVEGTRRLLSACADSDGAVERVVLTSSVAAVAYGHGHAPGRVFDENDWSVADNCEPYQKSKTLAERAAWQFVESLPAKRRFDLVVINPGFVLGPLLNADQGTSAELVRRLMIRDMPACPEIGWSVVDVRDVARAHLLAMQTPGAAGNRYICAGEHYWMRDMARVLADEFNARGYRVPTGHLPYWVLWIIARFDATIRMTLDYVGHKELVSNEKIRRDLGLDFRPLRQTLVDTASSMVEQGVVPRAQKKAA